MSSFRYIRLYHLISAEHALSNISQKRLKIATYSDLNDPFELLSANLADKRFRNAVFSMKKNEFSLKGLLCFSRNWDNPVLWSHYADKHKGIALGFDVPLEFASPVYYSPSRLALEIDGLDEINVGAMVHTKYSHWAYEDEVRMHVSLDEGTAESGMYFYSFDKSLILREVILGHSCTQDIDQMRNLVKAFSPSIKVIQARLAFKTFRVVTNQRHNTYKKKI